MKETDLNEHFCEDLLCFEQTPVAQRERHKDSAAQQKIPQHLRAVENHEILLENRVSLAYI
jgi:hypothetical protein